jgi:hypothetical protein
MWLMVGAKKNLRLKTNNKSTGLEAQSANYLKSRTDYTTQCQLVNAKLENDELTVLSIHAHSIMLPSLRGPGTKLTARWWIEEEFTFEN